MGIASFMYGFSCKLSNEDDINMKYNNKER